MCREGPNRLSASAGPEFTTTHWSVVLAAGGRDSPQAAAALERLCRTYWYPLYAHVRRRGYSPEDTEDLTQEFFARLLAGHWLNKADCHRGRFRSFLLSCLNHFLADQWHRTRAAKRGGGQALIPLDEADAEARYRREPADPADAERLYERRWALTLLNRVLERLQAEFAAEGKTRLFEPLQPFLLGEKTGRTYAEVAVDLRTTEGAVKMTVLRLRQRYRELLWDEIAQTVGVPEEVESELRYLRSVLRG